MIEYLIIQYFPKKKKTKKIMFDQIIPNNSIKKRRELKKIVENFTQEKEIDFPS